MFAFCRQHRRTLLLLNAALFVCALLLFRELRLSPQGHLHVHFLDVGQGDSALLITPTGRTVLIDGGPDLSTLEQLGKILPLSARSIDLMVVSHPDPDHFTAFPEVARRYNVGTLILPPVQNTEARYLSLLAAAKERGVPVMIADPSHDLEIADGLTLDFLWPAFPVSFKDDNDNSIVLRATFATGSILFTGDISDRAEESMLTQGIAVSADVLKVSHHGSKTASTSAFLAAVHPRLAVISVGKENTYGHPNPDTLERLKAAGIPVRTTMQEGEIDLVF